MEGDYNKPLIADPEFDRLIPKPKGVMETIKRHASLEDTIEFLPEAIVRVTWQVKKIVPILIGTSLEETCNNIWTRLYNGIRYCKDERGKEQIRSPRATWWGKKGDCDDFSVFVSAILSEMKIPHLFRIAMYKEKDGYQHIYPVALAPDGTEIVIDCVLSRFNKEVPYIKKIDKDMELQFLDGVEDENIFDSANSIDAQDLLQNDLGDLGRKKFKETKLAQKLTKGFHIVNRTNPITTLLRAGILAAMKINMFNIAGNLRYAYLGDEQAKQQGIIMSKFPRLKAIREKLEKIFYGAGGKEENLKKAILTGRGNRNKEVPLSGFGNSEDACDYNEDDGLPTLLGIETYHSEEIGSLGEPATAASIAAATSALTAIAAIIKSLGPLKKGNKSDTTSAESSTSIETTSVTSTDNTGSGGSITNPAETSASTNNITDTTKTPTSGSANTADTPATETDSSSADSSQQDGNDERKKNPATTGTGKDKTPAKLSGFARAKDWASKNKLAAAGIGLASVATIAALTYGVHKLVTKNKGKKKENKGQAVSGAPKKRRFDANGKLRIQQLRF